MGVTIKDLAEQLNVSPATVSLALNNRPGVNEQTRAQVLELANRLGYGSGAARTRNDRKVNGNIRLVV